VIFEFDQTENPLRDDLLTTRFELAPDGTVRVPDDPGLGVELNEDTVDRYSTTRHRVVSIAVEKEVANADEGRI
jgi:D-galactarolactone cycloisomerase